jgi:hypothetical protein
MGILLIKTTIATMMVAGVLADVFPTKSISTDHFSALPSVTVVGGRGTGLGELLLSEPACWLDKSGQPHCHA